MTDRTRRLLLVDDDLAARESLSNMLTEEGWRVLCEPTGAGGLRALREHRPDAVLVELYMEDLDGIEFLRAAREMAPETPLVAMADATRSSYGPIAGVAKLMGAHSVITKPVTRAHLTDLLRDISAA